MNVLERTLKCAASLREVVTAGAKRTIASKTVRQSWEAPFRAGFSFLKIRAAVGDVGCDTKSRRYCQPFFSLRSIIFRTPYAPSSSNRSLDCASWRETNATVGIPGKPSTREATRGSSSGIMQPGETNTAWTGRSRTVRITSAMSRAWCAVKRPCAAASRRKRTPLSITVATRQVQPEVMEIPSR